MKLSSFAHRFGDDIGIVQLMDDLGSAMNNKDEVFMLGGGNPAHIPEVQSFFCDCIQRIAADATRFSRLVGNYGPPQGDPDFIAALAQMFREDFGWEISADNIALTAGSQSAFFILFNALGGMYPDGRERQILLPMTPEYIGYSDVGLSGNLFVSSRPVIETFPDRTFKYHVDFDHLDITGSTGAICVSRPTNPTGNVIADSELARLDDMARSSDVPLIIDNAYGMPFPNIIFTDTQLVWNDNIILSMSLSKLGLPGTRTGIIVAQPDLIDMIRNVNGVINLALGNLGPALVTELLVSGEMQRLCNNVIRPYYKEKVERTVALLHEKLEGVEYYIHKPEGAIFLWLWLPDLPVSSQELYSRLKKRGVLVIPGEHFFPGLEEDWDHKRQCIRISYALDDDNVAGGIDIIAEEVKKL